MKLSILILRLTIYTAGAYYVYQEAGPVTAFIVTCMGLSLDAIARRLKTANEALNRAIATLDLNAFLNKNNNGDA